MNAVIADCAPPERRKEAFALLYWGNNIGFSIGPLAAGFLFSRAPRLLFVGNAAALAAAAAIVFLFMRETSPLSTEAPAADPGPETGKGTLGITSAGPGPCRLCPAGSPHGLRLQPAYVRPADFPEGYAGP